MRPRLKSSQLIKARRAALQQDRQGRQAPLPHPRHPVPRSRDGGRTAQGGARGSRQDRPQSLSAQSTDFPRRIANRQLRNHAIPSRTDKPKTTKWVAASSFPPRRRALRSAAASAAWRWSSHSGSFLGFPRRHSGHRSMTAGEAVPDLCVRVTRPRRAHLDEVVEA
jgi:hypothetical protein